MRFRLPNLFRFSPRTQRRLERIGATTIRVVGYPFRLVFGLAKGIAHVIAAWWESRNLRYLLQGLPALVVAIALVVVAAMLFFQDRSALAIQYQNLGDKSLYEANQKLLLAQENKIPLAMAQTAFKRLSRLQPGSDESAFQMARTYMMQRQPQAAATILRSMTPLKYEIKYTGPGGGDPTVDDVPARAGDAINPDDVIAVISSGKNKIEVRAETYGKIYDVLVNKGDTVRSGQVLARLFRGYGPAHYEVAIGLMMSGRPTIADLNAAEQHLIRAVQFKKNPYDWLAHDKLYDLYRIWNRPDEAEAELVAAVNGLGNQQPQMRIKLAEWYLQNGKKDLAERQVDPAVLAYERRLNDNIDDAESRICLIQYLTLAGGLKTARGDYKKAKDDYERAKILCQKGMTLSANTQPQLARQYALALERVFLSQYDAAANDTSFPQSERFKLLELAANLFPNDLPVLQRLLPYVRMSGPEGVKAKEFFQKVVDGNTKASALAHMFLGIDAWKHDDFADAKYHWERGFELSDGAPLIANNLAFLLATQDPKDLNRALALIDAALQKEQRPEYHGTKGHILAEQGKYREALPELEQAKPAFANDPRQGIRLWEQLYKVYSNLGMEREALNAKRHVEELKKQEPSRAAPAAPTAASPSGPAGPVNPDQKNATGGQPASTPKP